MVYVKIIYLYIYIYIYIYVYGYTCVIRGSWWVACNCRRGYLGYLHGDHTACMVKAQTCIFVWWHCSDFPRRRRLIISHSIICGVQPVLYGKTGRMWNVFTAKLLSWHNAVIASYDCDDAGLVCCFFQAFGCLLLKHPLSRTACTLRYQHALICWSPSICLRRT